MHIYVSNGRVAPCHTDVFGHHPHLKTLVDTYHHFFKFIPILLEFILQAIHTKEIEVVVNFYYITLNSEQASKLHHHATSSEQKDGLNLKANDKWMACNKDLGRKEGFFVPDHEEVNWYSKYGVSPKFSNLARKSLEIHASGDDWDVNLITGRGEG